MLLDDTSLPLDDRRVVEMKHLIRGEGIKVEGMKEIDRRKRN